MSVSVRSATSGSATLDAGAVAHVANQVWTSLLGLELTLSAEPVDLPAAIAATVSITGAWRGDVVLIVPAAHACAAAQVMFAAELSALSGADVADALGELVNIVAGNVKLLLPEPSVLSGRRVVPMAQLPTTRTGDIVLAVPMRSGQAVVQINVRQRLPDTRP